MGDGQGGGNDRGNRQRPKSPSYLRNQPTELYNWGKGGRITIQQEISSQTALKVITQSRRVSAKPLAG